MGTLILADTYRSLVEEMETLEKLMKANSLKIREAASHGDLKENAEYKAAKEKQTMIIRKKQIMQSHTPFTIIENSEIDIDKVGFGNKITIREQKKGKDEEYILLGPIEFELDLYPSIATYGSPFGIALIGKRIGEEFSLEIRGKKTMFTVTAIEKISVD